MSDLRLVDPDSVVCLPRTQSEASQHENGFGRSLV